MSKHGNINMSNVVYQIKNKTDRYGLVIFKGVTQKLMKFVRIRIFYGAKINVIFLLMI
jgi:hypothetical protein